MLVEFFSIYYLLSSTSSPRSCMHFISVQFITLDLPKFDKLIGDLISLYFVSHGCVVDVDFRFSRLCCVNQARAGFMHCSCLSLTVLKMILIKRTISAFSF
ncbi:hypothetical protein KC19_VG016600 [Ceratodon purpureus]|uniref:Uncharacterized protein n=1 Tax=Ceratodon purpureus TaxID=3225 RepID=A0A8T0HL03_CERPU|nr:hypothetical protein KC19_VG016600 [Ceratodon purpureus]